MLLEAALFCLAFNVHYEDGHEHPICQEAIVHSTLNRARHRKRSICETVFAHKQYSWTLRSSNKPPTDRQLTHAFKIVRRAAAQRDFTDGATHYHRFDVHPSWDRDMQHVGRWCSHDFYKE
jgi:spore germination cell wall hydrolase CwlJ-like protein